MWVIPAAWRPFKFWAAPIDPAHVRCIQVYHSMPNRKLSSAETIWIIQERLEKAKPLLPFIPLLNLECLCSTLLMQLERLLTFWEILKISNMDFVPMNKPGATGHSWVSCANLRSPCSFLKAWISFWSSFICSKMIFSVRDTSQLQKKLKVICSFFYW